MSDLAVSTTLERVYVLGSVAEWENPLMRAVVRSGKAWLMGLFFLLSARKGGNWGFEERARAWHAW